MNRIATLLVALSLCFQATAQNSVTLEPPRVDRNVELLSIVWRLADVQEYGQTRFKRYTDRIEEHFGEYRGHELVGFASSLHAEHGIGYDAVASMAIHLDGNMDLRRDVADGSLEGRWADVDKERFTTLLKKFAADTRFDEFYESNAPLYAEATARFRPVYEAIDLRWYADFFGREPKEKFVIVNALGNGSNNYGPSIEYSDGGKEVYAIMGAWSVDDGGMVAFPENDYLPILLHEFNHSFVNHLTAAHREAFRESGEKLFAVFGEWMRLQAYNNWETMLNEALVRAAVIRCFKDHGATQEQLAALVRNENQRGFAWTKPLVAELDKYNGARDEYPTLDDYMPRLAEAYPAWVETLTTPAVIESMKRAVETIRAQQQR